MKMRPVLLCFSLVVMVSSLEAFIDCETSCSKCKENADDPEIIDVYCSMCSECTERMQGEQRSKEQHPQSHDEDGHREDHQEDITPMPPLPGIDDVSTPDQTKEAMDLESFLRPRKPAPRIEQKPANQWRTNQMPRLVPAITAAQPVMNRPKRQRVPLKQRSPILHKPVAVAARVQGTSCPFAQLQAARNQAPPRALRQEYLNWPSGCPTPGICSEDDSYEEVPTTPRHPSSHLYLVETESSKRTTTKTTTTTTTPKPTCPPIVTCRKKRIKNPMPCAMNCMPMCCPPMPYNGNNGMQYNGNNGLPFSGDNGMPNGMPMPNVVNNGNSLPQYMPNPGNINPNQPNSMPEMPNSKPNIQNPNVNNPNGPGNINLHRPNNDMPVNVNTNEDNRGNPNHYEQSGNNHNAQNDNVQNVNNQNAQNSIQNGYNENTQNSNFQNGNNQSGQNSNIQNGYNQNGQNYNIQTNQNGNTGSGNQNTNNRPSNLIDETNHNQVKYNNNVAFENQGSNSESGNGQNRADDSKNYYNLFVGVPLGLLGPGIDPWRRSQQAQRRHGK